MDDWSDNFPYRRVAVTGGAGMLGRHLVARLRDAAGVEVFVPRRRDYDLVRGDDVRRMLDDSRPDLVIHLAAVVGGIGHNQRNPGRFFYENLLMGAQVIEESRARGVRKLVALGSACCYPKFTPVPFKEESIWDGYPEETNAPYGLAKRMLLAQAQAYREQYGFNGVFLLPTNLYGPGDNFDLESSHVIPALIRKCVAARREGRDFIEVWGTGDVSREFLYVEDCAEGVLRAAAFYDEPAPVNLGTGQEIYVKDLVALVARLTDFRGEIRWQPARPNGQPRRLLDTARAFERFGFRARTTLEEGLRKTIEWYEEAVSD